MPPSACAVGFDGASWDLARIDRPGPPRVGRYGVDVAVMDALAARLTPAPAVDVWLIDEIGKMESAARWTLSRATRDALPEKIVEWIERCVRGRA